MTVIVVTMCLQCLHLLFTLPTVLRAYTHFTGTSHTHNNIHIRPRCRARQGSVRLGLPCLDSSSMGRTSREQCAIIFTFGKPEERPLPPPHVLMHFLHSAPTLIDQ